MSEQYNPFEAALSTPGDNDNPFASAFSDIAQSAASVVDLGSQSTAIPFESPAGITAGTQNKEENPAQELIDLGNLSEASIPFSESESEVENTSSATENTQKQELFSNSGTSNESEEIVNPIAMALAEQDKTQAQSIFAKAPVFEHGSVKEPVENQEQTFEDLRIAKSDDFPELEDGIRVSWDVTYGKIRKSVPTPKKTKIGEFKKQIESSKEFMDALKKDKNKNLDCVIKPRITAQSKGEQLAMPSYKGVFTSREAAEHSGKIISIVPGDDGIVYEIRREEMGTFITPSGRCKELSEIQAGFTPALPPVPSDILLQIISFFRSVMSSGNYEALANIYWDREDEEFITVIPKQSVTAVHVKSELSHEHDDKRYLHYMDIHSHNVMPARFSAQDDADEKATRLYAVIGRLNEYLPELCVRMSNGGKYLSIDPGIVFEALSYYHPAEWNDRVTFGTQMNKPERERRIIGTLFGKGSHRI